VKKGHEFSKNEQRSKIEKAQEFLQSGDHQASWELYHKVCIKLLPEKKSIEKNALFISACLDLSQLGFILGKHIKMQYSLYIMQ